MSKGKGVFIATYFSFNDALIQAYTLPYVRIIRKLIPSEYPIYLFTIEKANGGPGSVSAKVREELEKEGIRLISVRYHKLGLGMLGWIPVLIRCLVIVISNRIGTIHSWCTPGGIIGYLLAIVSGKRLVLDSFEPHAEVMAETGTWRKDSLKFKLLYWFEKRMAKKAEVHICCTDDMKSYSGNKYGTVLKRAYVKPACVDLEQFHPDKKKSESLVKELGIQGKIIAVYAGKFGGLYLKQEAFDFFDCAYRHWGDRLRILLLTSETDENLAEMARNSGLPEGVLIRRFVPHEEVPTWMGLGDFGFAPYQPVPSRKHAAPIKVSEYLAMGLPVIITSCIADDSRLIEDNGLGSVIHHLDREGYRTAIEELDRIWQSQGVEATSRAARKAAETLRNFGIAEAIYQDIYR